MTRGAIAHAHSDRSPQSAARAVADRRWRRHVPKRPTTPHIKVRIENFLQPNIGVLCVCVCANIKNCDRSCVFIRSVQSVRTIGWIAMHFCLLIFHFITNFSHQNSCLFTPLHYLTWP